MNLSLRESSLSRVHSGMIFDRHYSQSLSVGLVAGIIFCLVPALCVVAQDDQEETQKTPALDQVSESDDPVAQLARQLESGEIELEYDPQQGYLISVLKALDVPVSSQILVFSKTSMQQRRITPRRPRAIYFNDDVYIGYCQFGEVLELASTDPDQGAFFYTLKQTEETPPRLVRDSGNCLICHESRRTQDVPGYLIRSVYPSKSGMPEFGAGTFTTDHTSPLEERWGGWYVTGTHGEMRHMGNAIFDKRTSEFDRDQHANITSLEELVSTDPYPGDHSDIVALMVIEHQTQMHNAIAWANHETRQAVHQSQIMNKALDRPEDYLSESSDRRINRAADRVVEHLLFCDEFQLTSPVKGTSGFQEEFSDRGPRDSKGRALRDFDLQTRMFRYPCSYLIYSRAFDALPEIVLHRIYSKLFRVLDGHLDEDEAEKFAHLSEEDCHNIREILQETKPAFRNFVLAQSPLAP